MKILSVFLSTFFVSVLYSANNPNTLVTVKINTISNTENVVSTYKLENWNSNAKLICISFTNKGDKTEYIKDISIHIDEALAFDSKSKFLYGGSCMGRTPMQQKKYDGEIGQTETVLVAQKAENDYYKVGILTWEIFRSYISFDKAKGITIVAEGEKKPVKPGETIYFEKIVLEKGTNWQDLLYSYGEQIAKVQNIKPKKIEHFTGWSTWDYYGQRFTDKEIKMNIDELKATTIKGNIIQVDGGWWNFRGDYLDSRTDIEGGMKGVSKMIAKEGFTPGIHIDGFRAEKGATIFKEHPEYFLRDQEGQVIFTEEQRPNRMEYKTYFDFSNPAAREYIKNVLKTMREDWGVKYFKIDFMRYGLNEDIFKADKKKTLKEIKSFDPSMTCMERTRAGLKAMKEGLGDGYLLGCSSVFGPTLGIVDGLRTGGDIFPTYDAYRDRCLQNGGNFYLHKTVVQNDADYLIVRNKDDEEIERAWKDKFGGTVTLNEAAMWADYIALFGGMHIESDNLKTLRPERKALVEKAFKLKTCEKFIPIDLWDKAKTKTDAFNIMLGTNDDGVYLVLFNWGDTPLGISLSNIPTDKIQTVNEIEKPNFKANKNTLEVNLKARTSLIFKLNSKTDFDSLRKQLEYKFSN